MSIIKDTRNLVLGNGDLFLLAAVGSLPSRATYKAAVAAGTTALLPGNVGAVKGTVNVQIVREIVHFEVGVPQEVVDQTVIREGIHLKCSLAEMDLLTVKTALGIPDADYTTSTAGATKVTAEAITLVDDADSGEPIGSPIAMAPVLFTGSTPAATANPVVFAATATATASNSPTSGSNKIISITNTTGMVAGGTVVIKDATFEELATIATDGVVASTSITVNSLAHSYTTPAVHLAYVQDTDYAFNVITNTICRLKNGDIPATTANVKMTYYYNELDVQIITGGGRSDLTTSALGFYHPYKDGRCSALFIPKANPAGSITLPFEEIAYGHYEFEMRAIADFTRPAGQHLYRMERELPQ